MPSRQHPKPPYRSRLTHKIWNEINIDRPLPLLATVLSAKWNREMHRNKDYDDVDYMNATLCTRVSATSCE
jgi:hypothetical protein